MTDADDHADVALTFDGRVATLRLDRPGSANALRTATADAIQAAVDEIAESADVAVVLVRGSGRSFCAGLDLSMLDGLKAMEPDAVGRERDSFYTKIGSIARIAVPTIAVLEGPAVTGGVGVAALCDLRVATPKAWIELTFDRLAFFSGLAIPQTLAARGSLGLAARALLTGERIPPEELHRHGFYDWLVEPESLEETLDGIVERILSADRATLMLLKRWLEHEVLAIDFRRTFFLEGALEGLSTASPGFDAAISRLPRRD